MVKDYLRIVCFNSNGLKYDSKRKMLVESSMRLRVIVLGLHKTHLFGQGVVKGVSRDEFNVWEGLKGGAV